MGRSSRIMSNLRKYNVFLSVAVLLVDVIFISGAFVLSHLIRENWFRFYSIDLIPFTDIMSDDIATLSDHLWLLLLIVPIWEGLLIWAKVFRPSRTAEYLDTIWSTIAAVLLATGIFGALAFGFQLEFLSRGVIMVFVALSSIFLSFDKCAFLFLFQMLRRRNRNLRHMLVVGTGARACAYLEDIETHSEWGIRVIGLIDKNRALVGTTIAGHKVIGHLEDIPKILATEVVDSVTFIVPHKWLGELGDSIRHCERQGVDAQVALDLFQFDIGRVRISQQGNIPMLSLESTSIDSWQVAVKRTMDIVVSVSLLVLLAPVMLACALAIRLSSPGHILFAQTRNGLRGRVFQMLKFRSMVDNAHELIDDMNDRNTMSGAAFKCENDPRVNRVGAFLRRFSLDELPQLVNVLRGEMSLVGPRPLIASERDKFEEWQQRRMSVRPGLTCLWQISGRNDIDFDRWMQLDLDYIDHLSIFNDFKILARTLPAVLYGKGAF